MSKYLFKYAIDLEPLLKDTQNRRHNYTFNFTTKENPYSTMAIQLNFTSQREKPPLYNYKIIPKTAGLKASIIWRFHCMYVYSDSKLNMKRHANLRLHAGLSMPIS